jgi:ribosomal protein S5
VRLIPAPRGAGIVAARTPKKVLQMAGIEDCYTSATGSTKTLGNFVKVSRPQAVSGPVDAVRLLTQHCSWNRY